MYRKIKDFLHYDKEAPGKSIFSLLFLMGIILIAYGFLWDTPWNVLKGTYNIVNSRAGLITDSMMVGGIGAAFVNAGLVTLLSLFFVWKCKAPSTGITIAAIFLMAGFALFGKDILNILPIIFGGWLYSHFQKETFARYIYISLFATALSPIVTELSYLVKGPSLVSAMIPLVVGTLIGFIMPAIAVFTVGVHQGYNLYNVGFSAGLVGMILASLLRSFGFQFDAQFSWSTGNNSSLGIFLFLLFGAMIFTGFWYNGKSFKNFWRITRHSGRAVADFVFHDSLPIVLINMGVIGALATLYILIVGGELNGPTIGGIMTVSGFGGFGKHVKNITPVVLGVILSSFVMVWDLNEPTVMLAALFATGLAPIAGQFGWFWGILAGVIQSSVVLNVSFLHGGLNLYNNGFSAGLVCIVLVPLAQQLHKKNN